VRVRLTRTEHELAQSPLTDDEECSRGSESRLAKPILWSNVRKQRRVMKNGGAFRPILTVQDEILRSQPQFRSDRSMTIHVHGERREDANAKLSDG
jgi:hypothetical protein